MFGGENLEDLKLEELSQKLESIEKDNEQIRRENQLFEFGRLLSAAENGRTGKYDAEKLMKYMEDKFKSKDALIDKLQLKNVSLKTQIMKAETQIKHKEEMGDDLKFIDFH